MFGDAFELITPGEKKLAREMGCYWSNFGGSGDPNESVAGCQGEALVPWPQYLSPNQAAQKVVDTNLVLDVGTVTTEMGLQEAQCDMFAKVPPMTGP